MPCSWHSITFLTRNYTTSCCERTCSWLLEYNFILLFYHNELVTKSQRDREGFRMGTGPLTGFGLGLGKNGTGTGPTLASFVTWRDFSAIDGLLPRFAPFALFFDHFGQFATLRKNCFHDVEEIYWPRPVSNFPHITTKVLADYQPSCSKSNWIFYTVTTNGSNTLVTSPRPSWTVATSLTPRVFVPPQGPIPRLGMVNQR